MARPVQLMTQSVPFKAQIMAHDQILVDPDSCPGPPHYASTIRGTGVGTDLGPFTANMHDCLAPPGPGLFVFGNGVFTLTAADGAELHGTYSGHLDTTPTTDQDAVFELNGSYEFTGGTQRFQNASGSGVMTGKNNTLAGHMAVTLAGTINFQGTVPLSASSSKR
jgi:hypothetical protein